MKLYYTFKKNLSLLVLPAVLISLVSCGSYQYSGYETDGIYGESRPGIWEEEQPQTSQVKPNAENSYYKNLFAQQSQMYGEILDGDVFTDVEGYSSNDGYDNYSEVGGDVAYVGGNAPWGQDPDTYTVNIIHNRGFYSPWAMGYGFGYPYYGAFYDPFYDPFFDPYFRPFPGYGRIGYGFGNPYGNPYWNMGFGFGYGLSYGYNFGFGGYPYYRNYGYNGFNGYGNPYYGNRANNVAYSRSRRNTGTYRDNDDRRSSYSRSIRNIRNSDNDYNNSRVRSSANDGYGNSRVYSRTSRRTESTRTYDNSRSSSPVYQRSSSSSNDTYRSSPSRRSSNSSSSGSTRSSSSSSRSSGSTTRSSSSRTSRGGRGGR